MGRGQTAQAPEGLRYEPRFVTEEEERAILSQVEALEFGRVVLHGVASKREVASFGWGYSFESNSLSEAAPIPYWLQPLRERAAALASLEVAQLAQALVVRYPPGAGIGYHRDLPVFGPVVVGISLLSACSMRFRRAAGEGWEVYVLELEPRSAYVMSGAARSAWQHGITVCREARYSITLRTLKRPRPPATAGGPSPTRP
ncbi:MAG: alpha-ketoglutarate-dependent dioxygenase AlkB [Deltaproteobacteria bacterium]|nr:alpha-ketoglutarate-dependent dioxygenase AlkB [Deltaproteobacteria bacterium]